MVILKQAALISFIRYDAGIQTFDTADVYSNGVSEKILGSAIKKYNLPRDEIVVMTKLWGIVGRTPRERLYVGVINHEEYGYVNQAGTSRKVSGLHIYMEGVLTHRYVAHLRRCEE